MYCRKRIMNKQVRIINKIWMFTLIGLVCLLVLSIQSYASSEADTDDGSVDLLALSIEELMDVEVTSVSKKAEKLFDSPAAIYVVTHEDIRRSGATRISEALRMVPGLQVANVNGNTPAITSRGFNAMYSNKLLVMIDGRTVYTPLFAGVYWNTLGVLLEDVDRIEVIRGPGGTLWGANAVNGVINIITRNAKDSQGVYFSGGGGSEERGFGSVRYGGKVSDDVHFRVYSKYFNRDRQEMVSGKDAVGQWEMLHSGFRLDWNCSAENAFTMQGGFYDGRMSDSSYLLTGDDHVLGGNVLGRFSHIISEQSDMSLQFYYNCTNHDFYSDFMTMSDVLDMDFQHRFSMADRHELIWGVGYRYYSDDITTGTRSNFGVAPGNRELNLFSGFIQDEIHLFDSLALTLGSKFEYNDQTNFEVQPSARMLWNIHDQHVVWASVSRAIRTPSRVDEDVSAVVGTWYDQSNIQYVNQVSGNRDMKSEELIAYELGYRLQPDNKISFDFTAFYNDYARLRSLESHVDLSNMPAYVLIDNVFDNAMHGETYGVELVANWQVNDRWKLAGSYTFFQMQLHLDADSTDVLSEDKEGRAPHNQFNVRSYLNITDALQFDTMVYYVDNLSGFDVDNYLRLDARLGWKINDQVELSLVGQNLIDNQHQEFVDNSSQNVSTEMQRGVYARLSLRF